MPVDEILLIRTKSTSRTALNPKMPIDPGDEAGSIYRAEIRICLMLVAASVAAL